MHVSKGLLQVILRATAPLISLVHQEGFAPPTHGLEVHPVNFTKYIDAAQLSKIKEFSYGKKHIFHKIPYFQEALL